MAVIQPDGLFNGKRLRRCSDQARLLWPYLFLAANGFGRLEIDYEAILRKIFVDFRKFPKPSEFFGILREYQDNGLIFLYEFDGRVWGQWDCKEGTLPRFKTGKDRKSPEPPIEEYEKWKKESLLKTKGLPNISEIFGKFPIGVGVGVGEIQTPSTAAAVGVGDEIPIEGRNGEFAVEPEPRLAFCSAQQAWFDAWWECVWLKVGKGSAERVFRRLVRTQDTFDMILAATKIQSLIFASKEPQFRPHPATWLNAKRWLDEMPTTPRLGWEDPD